MTDQARLAAFMAAYEPALLDAVRTHPEEYTFPEANVPIVAARMREAFARNSYNLSGYAIKAACKAVGIKHTRKAINAFLAGEPNG